MALVRSAFVQVVVTDRDGNRAPHLLNVAHISRVKQVKGQTVITMADANTYDIWTDESLSGMYSMLTTAGAEVVGHG